MNVKTSDAGSAFDPDHAPDGRLYIRVASTLALEIFKGAYAPGAKLPSEKSLGALFGVSRQTIRQALRVLGDQSLVVPVSGVGTLVRARSGDRAVRSPVRSEVDLLDLIGDTEMRLVSMRSIVPDKKMIKAFKAKPGALLSELTYTRCKVGERAPCCYVRVYVPERFSVAQITPEVFRAPVYQNIERMFGLRVREVQQETSAVVLDRDMAGALQVAPGEAALLTTRCYYSGAGELLEMAHSYFPGSTYAEALTFGLDGDR